MDADGCCAQQRYCAAGDQDVRAGRRTQTVYDPLGDPVVGDDEALLSNGEVEIVGLDLQADGGTHVANTREVGQVRVVDYKSKGAINKRIYIELEPEA